MQTVTFQCGLCQKLMAVAADYLGRQVRCPHCEQVVLAPAADGRQEPTAPTAAAEPRPEPMPSSASGADMFSHFKSHAETEEEREDIFSPPDEPDDLFGESDAPQVEMPSEPEPAAQEEPAELPHVEVEAIGATADRFAAEAADKSRLNGTAAPAAGGSDWLMPPVFEPAPLGSSGSATALLETPLVPTARTTEDLGRVKRAAAPGRGVSIWLVLPLISYSVLATALIITLFVRMQSGERHPLEGYLPDVDGDHPGVIRLPKNKGLGEERKKKLNSTPLAAEFRMGLGERREFGAVAVTPLRVAWEKIGVGPKDGRIEPLKNQALVLHLKVENISSDQVFHPLDRYYDRKYRENAKGGGQKTTAPLTLLEWGTENKLYGGPADWSPTTPRSRAADVVHEIVMKQDRDLNKSVPVSLAAADLDRELQPGESYETFLAIDGDDGKASDLRQYHGPLTWRVQVRRGLVTVGDREVPAAAVIGVNFTDGEVAKAG